MKTSLRPRLRNSPTALTRWYVSRSCTLLTTGLEASGQFAFVDTIFRRGTEPPEHVHSLENELFYVREGTVYFVVDGEGTLLRAGDALWIRKGVLHQFWLRTKTARCLLLYTPDPETNVPAVLMVSPVPDALPVQMRRSPKPVPARHYPAAHYVCSTCR